MDFEWQRTQGSRLVCNPNGIVSQSQGLARRAYPGIVRPRGLNHNVVPSGVAANVRSTGGTEPRCGSISFAPWSQGSRLATATLEEILEVVALRKSCELGDVVEAHIDDPFGAALAQKFKERRPFFASVLKLFMPISA